MKEVRAIDEQVILRGLLAGDGDRQAIGKFITHSTSLVGHGAYQAPVSWASPSTAISLLAACVVGAASKATAAVTEGELHPGKEAGREAFASFLKAFLQRAHAVLT